MPRCNSDMTGIGIGSGLLGNGTTLEDFGTQLDGLVVDFEDGQAFDRINAHSGGSGVTSCRFFDD